MSEQLYALLKSIITAMVLTESEADKVWFYNAFLLLAEPEDVQVPEKKGAVQEMMLLMGMGLNISAICEHAKKSLISEVFLALKQTEG